MTDDERRRLRGVLASLAVARVEIDASEATIRSMLSEPPASGEWESIDDVLRDAGARNFTEDELRRASDAWPIPRELWENVYWWAKWAQQVRDLVGVPLVCVSFYRPDDHDSKHKIASAGDLDIVKGYRSDETIDRLRMAGVQTWEPDATRPVALGSPAGLGIYRKKKHRLHLDVKAATGKGHRVWFEDEAAPYIARWRRGERV